MSLGIQLAERGWMPDAVTRLGIRRLLRERLREQVQWRAVGAAQKFLHNLPEGPLAVATDKANEQHYEVPSEYFTHVLGPRMKYSCGLYDQHDTTLAQAEERMLELTARRAQLADGMQILELGCGWGSLSLWMAEHYPQARITGVSNSHGQRQFIEQQCRSRGIENLRIITADINDFATGQQYDRIVSVEMFEHVRNHALLFRRMRDWLRPGGSAFVHIFCHKEHAYPYEVRNENDWMAKYFFTGGMMPSYDLLSRYDDALRVVDQWQVNGGHYYRTCMDWLARHDAAEEKVMALFAAAYGESDAAMWFQRWRLFYLGCAELFRYRGGEEWFVGHYRLKPVA